MKDDASATDRRGLIAAAEDWLSHRPLNSAVPLGEGVAELRFRCPDSSLSYEQVELLLAELALKRGLAIRFDRRDGRNPVVSEGRSPKQAGAGRLRG